MIPAQRLSSGRVPRSVIRRYVGKIVKRFEPMRVILFGSHASGRPTTDSDVDLMVVMPARDMINQSIRIEQALPAPFPLDLLVRTPEYLAKRHGWNDWFLREVANEGIVLYKAGDARVAAKVPSRSAKRSAAGPRKAHRS